MNIRDAAQLTGLSAHTIRYYEKAGVLPAVARTASWMRRFCKADITFLHFISALRLTGMSLNDIVEFTRDGCLLERLQAGHVPAESVARRTVILLRHAEKLLEQRERIDDLLTAVQQKLATYEQYEEHKGLIPDAAASC